MLFVANIYYGVMARIHYAVRFSKFFDIGAAFDHLIY